MASLNVQNAAVWGSTAQQFYNLFQNVYTSNLGTVTSISNSYATLYPWTTSEVTTTWYGGEAVSYVPAIAPQGAQAIEDMFPSINSGPNTYFTYYSDPEGKAGSDISSYFEPYTNTGTITIDPVSPTAIVQLGNAILTSSKQIVADSSTAYTFIPGAVQASTLSYEVGTTLTNSVTNGITNTSTTGETVSETTGVSASGTIPGASLAVNESVTQAWTIQDSQQISYTTTQTDAVNTNVTLSVTVDLDTATESSNDTWVWENPKKTNSFTLVPGNTYITEILITQDGYSTPVPNTFDISGPDMSLYMYVEGEGYTFWNTLNQNTEQAIYSANYLGYSQYSDIDSTLFSYETSPIAQAIYSGLVTSESTTGYNATIVIVPVATTEQMKNQTPPNNPTDQSALSSIPMMNLSPDERVTTLDLQLAATKLRSSYGIYYNNTSTENEIETQDVQINGYEHATVIVGNLDYTFSNFSNSNISTGSGNNKVLLGSSENGNSIFLGSGNDEVELSGSGNYIHLGSGSDWVNITGGTGKNFVDAGNGPTVITFNDSMGFTQLNHWDTSEDSILFSPDIDRSNVRITFDSTHWAYDVFLNNNHIANILTTGGLRLADSNSNVFTTTYSAPMPYNSQSNDGFISGLYVDAFSRPADSNGLSYWTEQLNSGASRKAVIQSFLASDEYNLAHPSNSQYVSGLYEDILGRHEDASGAAYYVGQLDSGVSRATLVGAFLSSAEFNHLIGAS